MDKSIVFIFVVVDPVSLCLYLVLAHSCSFTQPISSVAVCSDVDGRNDPPE